MGLCVFPLRASYLPRGLTLLRVDETRNPWGHACNRFDEAPNGYENLPRHGNLRGERKSPQLYVFSHSVQLSSNSATYCWRKAGEKPGQFMAFGLQRAAIRGAGARRHVTIPIEPA